MGKAIPSQHPAVVLRSHFQHLRALLAIAMIAVVGLTVAVVILANDNDQTSSTNSARPIESIRYGGFNPDAGRPESAPLSQRALPEAAPLPQRKLDGATDSIRYDGGPEEGTCGIVPAPPSNTRYDGRPEEGTRGGDAKDYSNNAATGDYDSTPAQPAEHPLRRPLEQGSSGFGQQLCTRKRTDGPFRREGPSAAQSPKQSSSPPSPQRRRTRALPLRATSERLHSGA
jgi:hypothetical protein